MVRRPYDVFSATLLLSAALRYNQILWMMACVIRNNPMLAVTISETTAKTGELDSATVLAKTHGIEGEVECVSLWDDDQGRRLVYVYTKNKDVRDRNSVTQHLLEAADIEQWLAKVFHRFKDAMRERRPSVRLVQ